MFIPPFSASLFFLVLVFLLYRRVPLRQAHPNMVHRIERSGAVVDMDMATCLLFKTLSAVGCDFHPLLVVEDSIQRESVAYLYPFSSFVFSRFWSEVYLYLFEMGRVMMLRPPLL